jgi:hypothetical protein
MSTALRDKAAGLIYNRALSGAVRTATRRERTMTDFTHVYVQRALEPRLCGHGSLSVERTSHGNFTIVHRYRTHTDGREVKMAVAQLRPAGRALQLFWKRANGRWMPYTDEREQPFVGSLGRCTREIVTDPWGCFWG